MNEFDAIAQYFSPLSPDGLKNDAAVLSVPEGCELVVTSDTLNEGTHFLESATPEQIAHKALRVNLSDLAAMGADPLAYQLNIAFSGTPKPEWLEAFTAALQADQNAYNIVCSGGDTTTIKGPLSISITAMGTVPQGQALMRSGAQDGDAIVLTGPVGDAYIGLHMLSYLSPHPDLSPEGQGADFGKGSEKYFIDSYYKPEPRLDLITDIRVHAHAAIDISDGLLADLGHICRASNLAAEIQMAEAMFSPQANAMIKGGMIAPEELLSAGDDYQLLLAAPFDQALNIPGVQVIGRFYEAAPEIVVFGPDGQPLETKHTGWSHF